MKYSKLVFLLLASSLFSSLSAAEEGAEVGCKNHHRRPNGGGATGATGPAGPVGPVGPAGANGATGATGPAGTDPTLVSAYTSYSNAAPSTVGGFSSFPFDTQQLAPENIAVTTDNTGGVTFTILNPGVYQVSYGASIDLTASNVNAASIALQLNTIYQPPLVVNYNNMLTSGVSLIRANAGDTLFLLNVGNQVTLSTQTNNAINAYINIERIAD